MNSFCDSVVPPAPRQPISFRLVVIDKPRTRIFFSGNLFPLATLSSKVNHMSFFASALLGRSCSLDWVYVEVLFAMMA